MKLLFETNATTPSSPSRSLAQRKAFTYGSLKLVINVARLADEYVSATLFVIALYFLFLLLSFSSTCQALYGGLPMTTKMGDSFCRLTRWAFSSFMKPSDACSASANSNVSTKQIPGNALYSPVLSKYACSMFMLAM